MKQIRQLHSLFILAALCKYSRPLTKSFLLYPARYTYSPINEYFDCINVSLSGEQVFNWFWSYDPIGGYNIEIKIDVTLVGTDGKNYTAHQIWNERFNWNENENKLNYVGRWCSTEQLK